MFIVVMFAVPSFAMTQDIPDHETIIKEKKIEQLTVEYNLTPTQQEQLRASREKYKPLITEKETIFKNAQEKFSAGINNPTTSKEELAQLFQQKMDANNALYFVHFQSRMEFRDILTPDQRSKMITKYENVKSKNKTTDSKSTETK